MFSKLRPTHKYKTRLDIHSDTAWASEKSWPTPVVQNMLCRFAVCSRQTADTYGVSVSAQIIQDSMLLPPGTPSYDTIETELNWNMSRVC